MELTVQALLQCDEFRNQLARAPSPITGVAPSPITGVRIIRDFQLGPAEKPQPH